MVVSSRFRMRPPFSQGREAVVGPPSGRQYLGYVLPALGEIEQIAQQSFTVRLLDEDDGSHRLHGCVWLQHRRYVPGCYLFGSPCLSYRHRSFGVSVVRRASGSPREHLAALDRIQSAVSFMAEGWAADGRDTETGRCGHRGSQRVRR